MSAISVKRLPRTQSHQETHMNTHGFIHKAAGAVALAALTGATASFAAQSVIFTPPGTALLPNLIYTVPYAVSTSPAATPQFPVAETVVSIGTDTAGVNCNFQVEWEDWNGAAAGVSGPAAPPVGGTYDFTTQSAAVVPLFPYTLNVFSDVKAPFEGHAHVRTDCPTGTAIRVDAGFVRLEQNASGSINYNYKAIEIVKPTGNTGD
jgi:hypothetical protein